jgi:hypothetical protein
MESLKAKELIPIPVADSHLFSRLKYGAQSIKTLGGLLILSSV